MLSPVGKARHHWSNAKVAFYAYTKAGNDRELVRSFVRDHDPEKHGWFYNKGKSVSGWVLDPSNNFYAPKG
jgi:hypothetical protein